MDILTLGLYFTLGFLSLTLHGLFFQQGYFIFMLWTQLLLYFKAVENKA